MILDADRFAHEILAPGGAAVSAVLQRFGPEVAGPDGGIDRRRLRSVVFADPAARRDLEAITHPLIYAAMASRLGRGGMTAEEAAAVIAAQAPAERKLAAADYVLDNRGSLADLEAGVETLWADLLDRFGSRISRG